MQHQSGNVTSWTALELSRAIHSREVSCREVMSAFLDRIDERNPTHNAIVARRDRDTLLTEAAGCDEHLARGESFGWMHGMPQAIKDVALTAGLTTTFGSPLMADFVPKSDGLVVSRMKAAGALVVGKTNVPEFGLGSHTFNEVYGTTYNAYDATRTAGGSSGGAAVALATGMLPVADGSDLMGSLRNPAAFNNVFGFRPSQGRVPMWPVVDVWMRNLATEGPMGRSVLDVAALLATQAGPDPRVPLAIDTVERFDVDAVRTFSPAGVRVGWLGDLDGYLATEPGIVRACESGLRRLESIGCRIDPTPLGYDPAPLWDSWLIWRRILSGASVAPYVDTPERRAKVKPEAQWEYDGYLRLTGPELIEASNARTRYYQSMLTVFDRFDVLALPTAQVWPFDAAIRWPSTVTGRPMDCYHRWMESTMYATFAGLPAISVPVGFNDGGVPAGMQLIGRPKGDLAVLQLAHAYEQTIDDLHVGEG